MGWVMGLVPIPKAKPVSPKVGGDEDIGDKPRSYIGPGAAQKQASSIGRAEMSTKQP